MVSCNTDRYNRIADKPEVSFVKPWIAAIKGWEAAIPIKYYGTCVEYFARY